MANAKMHIVSTLWCASDSVDFSASFFVLRGSVSSQNIASPRKDQANEADSEQMDISTSVEITFRYLRDRIDQLEKDKVALIIFALCYV